VLENLVSRSKPATHPLEIRHCLTTKKPGADSARAFFVVNDEYQNIRLRHETKALKLSFAPAGASEHAAQGS
jgi:hypothetical protein